MSGGQRGARKRRAAIVGAGFGGLGAAIRLQQQGLMDFEIFERGASAGGVWRANTYPGAACDVPSHYYSLSFAPGHRWSRRFAPQTEILDYLKGLVDEFGLAPHLHLNTEVTSAQFDQARGLWTVETGDGQSREFDVLITACGQLTNPTIPALPGLEQFAGESFHSAYWNRDVALAGKRVAVIGTGASAIQFVPEIAPQVGHLDIYQRSASWILPKPDRSYPEWERKLFRRFPLRVAAARAGFFAAYDLLTYAFTGNRMAGNVIRKLADGYRNYALKGRADLIDKMTPHYDIGCKRLLLTNDWYPALRRDNVALHHGKLQGITANGVIGPDGVERAVDVIIWGTGFDTGGFVAPMKIRGADGRELNEIWGDRPEAFLGTSVTGFPNLFVLYGPNTNHGSASIPYVEECQIRLMIDAVKRLHEGGYRYLDVKPESQARWREEIERRSEKTTWVAGGCSSWYLNQDGVNTHNWPGEWIEFRRRTSAVDPRDYRFVA